MNPLFDTFLIQDIAGGTYLAIYTALGAALAAGTYWRTQRNDPTIGMRPEDFQDEGLDPYAIAYLSGGANEVASLILHDLVRRGWLEFVDEESVFRSDVHVRRAPDHPPVSLLNAIETKVWRQTETPELLSNLMGTRNISGHIQGHIERFSRDLSTRHLMWSGPQRQRRWVEAALGIVAAALPGLYRVGGALAQDAEEWFTYVIWTLLVTGIVAAVARPSWRTDRGERTLNELRKQYGAMRDHLEVWGDIAASHMVTLGAVFGARTVLAKKREAERQAR